MRSERVFVKTKPDGTNHSTRANQYVLPDSSSGHEYSPIMNNCVFADVYVSVQNTS